MPEKLGGEPTGKDIESQTKKDESKEDFSKEGLSNSGKKILEKIEKSPTKGDLFKVVEEEFIPNYFQETDEEDLDAEKILGEYFKPKSGRSGKEFEFIRMAVKNKLEEVKKNEEDQTEIRQTQSLRNPEAKKKPEGKEKKQSKKKTEKISKKEKKEKKHREKEKERVSKIVDDIYKEGKKEDKSTDDKLKSIYQDNSPENILRITENKKLKKEFLKLITKEELFDINKDGKIVLAQNKEGNPLSKAVSKLKEIHKKEIENLENQNREELLDPINIKKMVSDRTKGTETGKQMFKYMDKKKKIIFETRPRGKWDKVNLVFDRQRYHEYKTAKKDLSKMDKLRRLWSNNEWNYIRREIETQEILREELMNTPDGKFDKKTQKELIKSILKMIYDRNFISENIAGKAIEQGNFDLSAEKEKGKYSGARTEDLLNDFSEKEKILDELDIKNTSIINNILKATDLNNENRQRFIIDQSEESIQRLAEELRERGILLAAVHSNIYNLESFNATELFDLLDMLKINEKDEKIAHNGLDRQINIALRKQRFQEIGRGIKNKLKEKAGDIMSSDAEVEFDTKLSQIIEEGGNNLAYSLVELRKKQKQAGKIAQGIIYSPYAVGGFLNNCLKFILPTRVVALETGEIALNDKITIASKRIQERRDTINYLKKRQREIGTRAEERKDKNKTEENNK